MNVSLKTSRRTVSFGAFASDTFGDVEAPPAPAQSLPRITVAAQRMGQVASLDLKGITADSIEWLNEGETTGQTGSTLTVPMHGAISARVTSGGTVYDTPPVKILHNHANASHNTMDDATLAVAPHQDATHIAIADGNWTNPATWDVGSVPASGSVPLVPIGRTVTYNSAIAPRLDRIRVDGTLAWALDRSTEMLVETLVVQHGGNLVMGNSVFDRLLLEHTAKITISNRAYRLDPANPTDLDLANDPTLVGRGIVVLGEWKAFGFHRDSAALTAALSLPLAGDISVTLDRVPSGWQVGDRIVIPGTAIDLDVNGVSTRYDEERIITAIAGPIVSFADALIHNHDHHNASVVVRSNMRVDIINTERNIIVQSEAGAAIHQRGHNAAMHGASNLDIWDVGIHRMGRTDKSKPAGIIDLDGSFKYVIPGTKNTANAPLTADANLQSRYPIHGHFMGFKKPVRPLVRDCYVEDAKGLAGVHHGCEMDWIGNVFYRYQGSGLVAETGDELGRWDKNVTVGLETLNGSYRFPKGQEEKEGISGDFGKWGYGFYYRGRAMVVTRNTAYGATFGHVFYHRGGGLSKLIEPLRVNLDVNDLNLSNGTDSILGVDYPIAHFDSNRSIGCYGGFAVVKAAADQGHDLNIRLTHCLGWALSGEGVSLNYVGGYLIRDALVIRSRFVPSGQSYGSFGTILGFGGGKNNQIAWDRIEAVDFEVGLSIEGQAVQGIDNTQFSQTDPRFIVGNTTFVLCETDISYNGASTISATKVFTPPITYLDRPSIAGDFIVGDYNNVLRTFTVSGSLVKTDTVSNARVIPKAWDLNILTFGNQPHLPARGLAEKHGLWDYTDGNGTHKILLLPFYWSDSANAMSIKTMQAVKWTSSVGSYRQNGSWSFSDTPPVCADITINATTGMSGSFNALGGATGAAGTTLSLNIPEFVAGIGTDAPAHFKPNYMDVTVGKSGLITYKSVPGFVGTDRMLVYVYDGKGRFCTVEITFNVEEPV